MATTALFYAQFTTGGLGADDLTVTIDITRINRSTGAEATELSGGSATQVTLPAKRGLYFYRLANADFATYDYIAVFVTAGTADLKEVPALGRQIESIDGALDSTSAVGSQTLRQLQRLIAAALGGKSSNDGADYRDIADTKTVINSTLDANGNRTAVSLDLT